MHIGFSNGNYHRFYKSDTDRFSEEFLDVFVEGDANIIELHCLNRGMIDFLVNNNLCFSGFSLLTLHLPCLAYQNNQYYHTLMKQLVHLCHKYPICNITFHPDTVVEWSLFDDYMELPLSIENMDNKKTFGKTIKDIGSILNRYSFGLTLDLQHCFVNDPSMQLAKDFHHHFSDRISEYHISGFDSLFNHYSLHKKQQDIIIKSLLNKSLPIIIESEFEHLGDHNNEILYISERII